MSVYEYKALDRRGKTVSGVTDAESVTAVRQKLRSSGTYPVAIKKVQDSSIKPETGKSTYLDLFSRVKSSEVAMMTRQLATLINAGFPLVTAIDSLLPHTKSYLFKKKLTKIKNSIVEGNSFSSALSSHSDIFSPLFVNMVNAGEASGTLDQVLERLADIMEKQQNMKNRIRAALAYPLLMGSIGTIVLFILLAYIVPGITSIFEEMNQTLPVPTILLITVSSFIKTYWWIIIILFSGGILTFKAMIKTKKGKYLVDKVTLLLPGIGPISIKIAVARLARTLGSLLENGVPMLAALEIVKKVTGNLLISELVENAAEEVGKGQGLSKALALNKLLPDLFIQMVQVGEQSGKLESMLKKIADVFDNEVESRVVTATSMLEPIMILVMGIMVGFIVLSILLPIFEMNQLVL